MRILQVHNLYREPGGEDAVVRREAKMLGDQGHEIGTFLAQNPLRPIPSATAYISSLWNVRAEAQVGRSMDQFIPDVVHVHNTWFTLSPAVLRAAHKRNIPTVVTLHNYRLLCVNGMLYRNNRVCHDCLGATPWRGVTNRCYRGSAATSAVVATGIAAHRALQTWDRYPDRVIVLNEFAREMLMESGISGNKLVVKANTVEDPGPRSTLPSESNTFLFVGRLEHIKGIEVLLEAWCRLGRDDLRLIVLGDGPLQQNLQRQAVPNVRFEGQVSGHRVKSLMLGSRALVFPSLVYEGQPTVVTEALAAGLPVIASELGGNAVLLKSIGRQTLVRPNDELAWRQAIERVAQAEDIDLAGRQARDKYDSYFSPTRGVKGLENVYRAAISARERRA